MKPIKQIFAAIVVVVFITQSALAGSISITQGSGTTLGVTSDGTNDIYVNAICGAADPTLYAQCANQVQVNASGQMAITGPVTNAGTFAVQAAQSGGWTVGITGSLPLPTGAATAANQEVTAAGSSATSAQAIQGVTGGVAIPTLWPGSAGVAAAGATTAGSMGYVNAYTQQAPNVLTTGTITTADIGQTCSSTGWGNQTACTGTPTVNSAVQVAVTSAGYLWVQGVTTGGTPTVNFVVRISNDGGTTWFNRGIFQLSNPAPFQVNNMSSQNFAGWLTGGVTNVEVVATTYTGSGSTAVTITQGQSTPFVTSSATSSSANGDGSAAATNVQGNGSSALPINGNIQQWDNTTLGAPTAVGTQGTGNAPNINATIVGGAVSATFTPFAPNGSFVTPLSVSTATSNVGLPTGTVIKVDNTGSNAAYVNLGTSSGVTATASENQVAPGGFQCFAVGTNTFLAAVTSANTTTLNISGGTGGCAGSGGGGGSGSGGTADTNLSFSGGPISAANNFSSGMVVGNYMSTQGLVGYSSGGPELTGTCTTNSCMSTSGFAGWNSVYLECTGGGSAGTNWFEVDTSGGTGGTLQKRMATFTGPTFSGLINVAGATFLNVMADQYASGTLSCTARASQNFAQSNVGNGPISGNFNSIFSASTATTARVITGVPGLSVVVTAVQSWTDGSAAAAGSVQVVAGTGTNCATNKVNLSKPMNFQAGNGVVTATSGQFVTAPPGDDICITTTNTNAVNGSLTIALR